MKKLILPFYYVFEVAIVTKKKSLKLFHFKLITSYYILLNNLKGWSLLKLTTFCFLLSFESRFIKTSARKRQKKKPEPCSY